MEGINPRWDWIKYQNVMRKYIFMDKYGLEIGPLHHPYVKKEESQKIFYVDWQSTEALKKANENNPTFYAKDIVDIDFIWEPGTLLRECIPQEYVFDYILASHVLEHIPDLLGWIYQLFSVLREGGILTLGIPDKRYILDAYRPETTTAEVIEAFLHKEAIPTVRQIYDCISNAIEWSSGYMVDTSIPLAQREHKYTAEEALNFATFAYFHQKYLDMHCTVWTPNSFEKVMEELIRLGFLDIDMEIVELGEEANSFVAYLRKKSNKRPAYPPPVHFDTMEENRFLRKAYQEALDAQKTLIEEKTRAEEQLLQCAEGKSIKQAPLRDDEKIREENRFLRKAYQEALDAQKTLIEEKTRAEEQLLQCAEGRSVKQATLEDNVEIREENRFLRKAYQEAIAAQQILIEEKAREEDYFSKAYQESLDAQQTLIREKHLAEIELGEKEKLIKHMGQAENEKSFYPIKWLQTMKRIVTIRKE